MKIGLTRPEKVETAGLKVVQTPVGGDAEPKVEQLVRACIREAGAMPDVAAHARWLRRMSVVQLSARLAQLVKENENYRY